jgi:short-subunit dehydrogenase
MAKLESYKGLTALITGASSGIGKIIAKRMASQGAKTILVARSQQKLLDLASEIHQLGGEAVVVQCDVSNREAVESAVNGVLSGHGTIDILVNNAGYGHHRTFLEWDIDDQERMMQVNYFGMVYFTKLLLPKMVEQQKGWIVFIASVAGKLGTPEESAYAATKFATVGLAEALSLEVEDDNVHVLTVCPGAINTPFFDEEALNRMPPVAKRTMADPEKLVDEIIKALARGKHEVTYPRGIAAGYIVRALAPGFMRKQVKRVTLNAIARQSGS